jgi:hypothetical protein
MDKQQIEYIESKLKEMLHKDGVREGLQRLGNPRAKLTSHEDEECLLLMVITDHQDFEIASAWKMKGRDLLFIPEVGTGIVAGHLGIEHGVYFVFSPMLEISNFSGVFSTYPDSIRILSSLSNSLVRVDSNSNIWRKLIREERQRPKSNLSLPLYE